MKRVAILGATGSIGASALAVIERHPERYRASVLTANGRVEALIELCRRHRPAHAVIADPQQYAALRDGLAVAGLATSAHAGAEALAELAGGDACDTVIAAIVGAAGVPAVLAAARAGQRLLLANKEAVVVAGDLLLQALAAGGAPLLPVDSEHNAIFQCLPAPAANAGQRPDVRRLILTASGGPFRDFTAEQLAAVTPAQAVAHPNWSMGQKISVDSASLMNKGLEAIEAHWLFAAPAEKIEILVHRQSIVHSLVDYVDGSMLAQLGNPDMRTALAYGLAWPERIDAGVAALDLARLGRLDFVEPRRELFPCLDLAFQALRAGVGATTVLNAANEIAVAAFLQGRLGFMQIPALIAECLERLGDAAAGSDLPARLALDRQARELAATMLSRSGVSPLSPRERGRG